MTATALRCSEELSIELNDALFPKVIPWIEQNKTFKHAFDVYLKDSNATGNIYFARYFEWQGICREKWFFECIAPDMLQSLGVFVTKEARQNYIHETFAFQRIVRDQYLRSQAMFFLLTVPLLCRRAIGIGRHAANRVCRFQQEDPEAASRGDRKSPRVSSWCGQAEILTMTSTAT
jgi:hypothetical protein